MRGDRFSLCADQHSYRRCCGNGRGWLLMALGTVLYPEEFFSTLFMGMICSAVWSGIMMMGFCRKGSTEIPFVPFLLAGYLGGFLI